MIEWNQGYQFTFFIGKFLSRSIQTRTILSSRYDDLGFIPERNLEIVQHQAAGPSLEMGETVADFLRFLGAGLAMD